MDISLALSLSEQGFYLFPLVPDGKTPAIKEWQNYATRDKDQIRKWFADPAKNAGIFTGKFGDDEALIVVDVDIKNSKNGEESMLMLELEGKEFPATLEQVTASGGRHLIYKTTSAKQQGVDVLGSGLDIRSHGGFIVAPGSVVAGNIYKVSHKTTLANAPEWLETILSRPKTRAPVDIQECSHIDKDRARIRGIECAKNSEIAVEGSGGDLATFKIAAKLKDLGCSESDTVAILLDHWNPRCAPPWPGEDIVAKVRNAFAYGNEPIGASAPEAVFESIEYSKEAHPIEKMNEKFAVVMTGGQFNVLWETKDSDGNPETRLLGKTDFENMHAGDKLLLGEKSVSIAKAWLESPERRRYFGGLAFAPNEDLGPDWYNLWRGFSVTPADTGSHPMVERWKEHLFENVCGSDPALAHWLTCWFAHLIQKPNVKPLVGIVFKGRKGTGKNALVERVKSLLGPHAMVTSRRRYLISNFTSHLQRCLLFVLDEAFWSGDKEAEGVVKDLVTGSKHTIEMKGREPYEVKNLTRVVIIGNEEWLVPATEDERRWAVFSIGEGRMQDRKYFEEMRIGLDDKGGNAHLLRYLLDYKITADINHAPHTSGLVEQKIASLDLISQWWHSCLDEGEIAGGDIEGWPKELATKRLHLAFERYAKSRNTRSRLPNSTWFGRAMSRMGVKKSRSSKAEEGSLYTYDFSNLAELRAEFERYIGGDIKWQ